MNLKYFNISNVLHILNISNILNVLDISKLDPEQVRDAPGLLMPFLAPTTKYFKYLKYFKDFRYFT